MSKQDVAIDVDSVTKRFKLYHNVITGPIKELLMPWRASSYYESSFAVRDVSLTVKRGEVVGLVGPNGAGKSTLLKMIAGLLPVDGGRVTVNGKITALLALGVGVHPEFSGRENILYGGMLLGMTKAEVQAKMEQIVEFAELGDYINRPFRTYSSGMKARLLFATSMSIDPDILIVDEALSTGDAYFVQKSAKRIHEMCQSGATVLFVSHNLRQIESLCQRCVVLQKGEVVFDGEPNAALGRYVDSVVATQAAVLAAKNEKGALKSSAGTGEVEVGDVRLMVAEASSETVVIGQPCQIEVDITAAKAFTDLAVEVRFYSEKSSSLYAALPSDVPALGPQAVDGPATVEVGSWRVRLDCRRLVMGDGNYHCDVLCFASEQGERRLLCQYEKALHFQAVHRRPEHFGRGTVSEIPLQSLRVEAV